jgi:hypothetical protein
VLANSIWSSWLLAWGNLWLENTMPSVPLWSFWVVAWGSLGCNLFVLVGPLNICAHIEDVVGICFRKSTQWILAQKLRIPKIQDTICKTHETQYYFLTYVPHCGILLCELSHVHECKCLKVLWFNKTFSTFYR